MDVTAPMRTRGRAIGRPAWLRLSLLLVLMAPALVACNDDGDATPPTPTPGECTPTATPSVSSATATASAPPAATATQGAPPTATATQGAPPTATTPLSPTPTLVPADGMLELEAQMQEEVDDYRVDGRYAVAVTDLQTGETVGVNQDVQHLSGCVMNLFVLILSMKDVQEGAPIEAVGSLVDTTIYSSNATAARALFEIAGDGDTTVGVQRVSRLLASLGLTSTVIDHPPAYSEFSLGVSSDNWITARDANTALAALYRGDVLVEPHRSDLLERMTHVKPGLNYLTAYGTGGVVSHKNGFFPLGDGTYVDNDVGIVRFERGGREYAYAISFFSDFVETKYGDIALGQRLSRLAWAYFDAAYGSN